MGSLWEQCSSWVSLKSVNLVYWGVWYDTVFMAPQWVENVPFGPGVGV